VLPDAMRPLRFDSDSWDKEPWEVYRTRLSLPDDEAVIQFYRQVVYDHFDHFNYHYPLFALEEYDVTLVEYSAQEASEVIRFFRDTEVDFWGDQYDDFERRNYPYLIFQEMSKRLTAPFPPVLIDSSMLKDEGWRIYGRPIHLIEGTHRVGYLRHMLAKGIVSPVSRHKFVLLRPKHA